MAQNFLSPIGFQFTLKRAPTIEYYIQEVEVPGISSGSALIGTPFSELAFSADKLVYEDLTINFRVDENLANYLEIFNWFVGITYPDQHSQYATLSNENNALGDGVYSDGSLLILNSTHNPNVRISFENMFPISLSSIPMNVKNSDLNYVEATATFKYQRFTVTAI